MNLLNTSRRNSWKISDKTLSSQAGSGIISDRFQIDLVTNPQNSRNQSIFIDETREGTRAGFNNDPPDNIPWGIFNGTQGEILNEQTKLIPEIP